MSSTVLMKCDWPIMMLASAGISIRTVRNSSMLSPLFPGFSSCAFPVLRPNPFNVPSSPEVDTHSLARSNEQRNLYDQAIFERGFLAARVLLRTRGRCGADHASLNSVGQNNTDWLSLEKTQRELRSQAAEIFQPNQGWPKETQPARTSPASEKRRWFHRRKETPFCVAQVPGLPTAPGGESAGPRCDRFAHYRAWPALCLPFWLRQPWIQLR